jgi:hypothetical protein
MLFIHRGVEWAPTDVYECSTETFSGGEIEQTVAMTMDLPTASCCSPVLDLPDTWL